MSPTAIPFPGGFVPPIQPELIHVGRADLWVDVDVPVFPAIVPIPGGVPATGDYVGATMDATIVNYNPSIFDIITQQTTGVVGTIITAEELSMQISLGELTYQHLKRFLLGAADGTTFIHIGGITIPTPTSVLLVAPRRAGGFITVFLYSAVFIDNRQFSFNRAGNLVHQVRARSQMDIARPLGAQLGYFNPHQTG